jgi:CheY-like chemotaxis protein
MSVWQDKTVLVVDDSPGIRTTLTATFKSMGLKPVGSVENGVKALEFIEKEKPDVVSLDIIMPEMDGIECYRKIREFYPDVDILIVSCLASEQKVSDGFSDEIPSYVFSPKPFTKASLGGTLDYILAKEVDLSEGEEENPKENSGKSDIPDVNQIA